MGSNIPIQLTRFIGREWEIGDLKRLLADTLLLGRAMIRVISRRLRARMQKLGK